MTKQVVVIAGPSGSGKNTLIKLLMEKIPHSSMLVTATTRPARSGESDGKDYFFMSPERFDQELMAGNIKGERFVMLADGVHYGILLSELKRRLTSGGIIFAPVDIMGARYLKEEYGATTIFLTPESADEFRRRIHGRNPDMSKQELEMRMKIAEQEMRVHAPQYDYTVVSADGGLPEAEMRIMEILKKEGYHLS